MQLHDLKSQPGAFTRKKRVGRGHGSGWVKTAGRGSKGQNSRAGGRVRPGFEGGQNPIYRRMPYKRGFTNPFRVEYQIVNLGDLEGYGLAGTITPEVLFERGVIGDLHDPVKILANGEFSATVTIHAHKFSAAARARIEESGGVAEVIG